MGGLPVDGFVCMDGLESASELLLPQFGYGLDDLTKEREEALLARPGPALARLVLLALVYGRSEQLAQRLPGWS